MANRLSKQCERVRSPVTRRTEGALVVTKVKRTFFEPDLESSKPPARCDSVVADERQIDSIQASTTQKRYFEIARNIIFQLRPFGVSVHNYFITRLKIADKYTKLEAVQVSKPP